MTFDYVLWYGHVMVVFYALICRDITCITICANTSSNIMSWSELEYTEKWRLMLWLHGRDLRIRRLINHNSLGWSHLLSSCQGIIQSWPCSSEFWSRKWGNYVFLVRESSWFVLSLLILSITPHLIIMKTLTRLQYVNWQAVFAKKL
jgi:hypothetical protein